MNDRPEPDTNPPGPRLVCKPASREVGVAPYEVMDRWRLGVHSEAGWQIDGSSLKETFDDALATAHIRREWHLKWAAHPRYRQEYDWIRIVDSRGAIVWEDGSHR